MSKASSSCGDYSGLVNGLRAAFNTHKTKSIEWRREQLINLEKLINENTTALCAALKKDMNRPAQETICYELELTKSSIHHALKSLNELKKLQPAPADLALRVVYSASIQYQPYGVVLIIGAWNYPYQLTLLPLVGAIASGNCVLVKPSEISINSANLIEELIDKYLDKVINA
jgi:aldehyde dehydrogenase (NAD+)